MPQTAETPSKPGSRWSGWLFRFEKTAGAPYSAAIGLRMLIVCLALEGLARPYVRDKLRSFDFGGTHTRPLAIASFMTVLAIGLTAAWIRLPFSRVGLYRWREWTASEKWYLPQILAVSLVAFTLAEWNELAALPLLPEWIQVTLVVFAGQMAWGFYQEYVYRGLLQTELVRRWVQSQVSW